MYTPAQQLCLELRKKGTTAALFEGKWRYVFELGKKIPAGSAQKNICGFKTYEGGEYFFEILKTHIINELPREPFLKTTKSSGTALTSSISPAEYVEKILEIKELIRAGETYQVNYSVPFKMLAANQDPFELYCALARLNPSPYMCFIEIDEGALISNSPECLFRLDPDGYVETHPIKGTLPRGATRKEDEINARTLLESEKNKAELAMIVDLERNDLGKVCTPGSVRVTSNRRIEKYSHVIHTVSTIEGHLIKGKTWRDTLEALFPGGSVTGCPKQRTMEIIKRLEDCPRGIYCGSAGFVTKEGEANFNILIRSLWFDKTKEEITFRSGGGIVADSDPQEEWKELIQKAGAMQHIFSTR